jgi:hypothetical protein
MILDMVILNRMFLMRCSMRCKAIKEMLPKRMAGRENLF